MPAPSPPPSIIPQATAPQPAAEPPPARVAALPPPAAIPTPIPAPSTGEGTQVLRIEFGATSGTLSAANENSLKGLAGQMAANDQRIQLKAFASGNPDNLSAARRLSLSRALAVRSYLIEQGIRSTRIDVRALGLASDGGPLDRVDVLLAGR
ncbi:MAG: hypothetical protein FJX47_14120 [Alphaproteobacteria bacterium]|nr:hypothetical protein [Alphaproteobacteria bacterium]